LEVVVEEEVEAVEVELELQCLLLELLVMN
jgi:hypothetical protein